MAVADGGFSGAAVLLLSFRLRSGRRAAALKISESEGLLRKEARASARAVAASGKFGYAFQSVQGPERIAIGGRTLYANEQVFVDGRTLEDFALGSDESSFAKMVRGLGELLAKATGSGLNDASRPLGVPDALALTDVQLLRFERSIEELEAIWSALQACTPGVNKRLGLNKAAFGALRGFARNWLGAVAAAFPSGVLLYEQHGDLHGRNLMVLSEQRDAPQLKFIDAARFGAWPALYDLCRLRLNLAVRLLDPPSSGLDHVPDRMQVWEDAWTNATLASSVGGKQVAKGLRRFLSLRAAIGGVVDEQSKRGLRSGEAARLVALCESFDLFKMVCYVDSSAPRRLWLAARLNAAMRQLRGR